MKPRTAKATAFGAVVALLMTVFFLWIPTAAAALGAVVVRIEDDKELPSGRLLPETGQAVMTVKASVTVDAASACIEQIELTYRVLAAPDYASVVLNPSSQLISLGSDDPNTPDLPTTGAASKTYEAEDVLMMVSTTRAAPAFEDGKYEIEVEAKAGMVNPSADGAKACNLGKSVGKGSATVKNDYLPTTILNPSLLFVKTGQNNKILLPIEILNNGNGPTRITLEASQPGAEKLGSISVGSEVRLESRTGRGPQAFYKTTRNIEVMTPHGNGYTNSIHVFTLKVKSSFDGTASGTLQTDEQVLTFAVQVQGVYVPGFDPTLLIGALGLGLVVLRRRHGPV